jgi:hypothetical protein
MGLCPLAPATPMTVNGTFFTRTVRPMGSAAGPNRVSATVSPSTITLVPVSASMSVKRAPRAIDQLRMSK